MAEIDSRLATELKELLQRDERTAYAPIEALDNNGIITLVGVVNCHKIRTAANLIVANHPDVVSVINNIQVDDPEATTEVDAVTGDTVASDPRESDTAERDETRIYPIWPQRGDIAYPN